MRSGRIILLGDGTEVIPDQNEELFDQTEDQDLANQVGPRTNAASGSTRTEREGTPGPQGKQGTGTTSTAQISASPASTEDQEKPASS